MACFYRLAFAAAWTAALVAVGCAGNSTFERQHQSAAAQQAEQRAEKSRPNAPNHLALARQLMEKAFYQVALVQLEMARDKGPEQVETYHLMGLCHRGLNQPKQAVAYFFKALEMDDRYAPAYNGMGLTVQMMGDRTLAYRSFRKAIALDPAQADFHNNLGYLLLQDQRHAEAEAVLRDALAIDPKLVVARNNLAICLGLQGKDRQAMEILLATHPPATAFRNMSAIYHRRGDTVKASAMQQKADEHDNREGKQP